MDAKSRQTIERRIVRHLIREAVKQGYLPVSVNNGDEPVEVATEKQTLCEAFAADDALIVFAGHGERYWVYIVLGNDGYDVISDYGYVPTEDGGEDSSHPWNRLMDEVLEYASSLEG